MRTLMMTVLLVTLAGCAAQDPVVTYNGPQEWPTGYASETGTHIAGTPVVYGLPDRAYEVLQLVHIPRDSDADETSLAATRAALEQCRPDALVFIGSRYDQNLSVDQHLAADVRTNAECRRVIKRVRSVNADDSEPDLIFLAIRYRH